MSSRTDTDGPGNGQSSPTLTLQPDNEMNDTIPEPNFANEAKTSPVHDFPDGGTKAWLVAVGASSVLFCTMGFTNAYGVFQAYYMYHQLRDHGADDVAWIGSIQAFLIFATGAIAGPLLDRYGTWIIRPAAVVYVFSVMMVSISTKYWHFLLAQGFLQGMANGFLMFPSLATVQQWFNKKRGAAMGCAIAGSSLGGVIFPITLSNLLNKTTLSFGWSVRITGFMMIPFLTFASFAIQNRAPKRKTRFFIPESFKKPMYSLTIASIFCVLVGMFVPLFMLPAYGISHHMSDSMSNYLLAIINGASFFGRVLPGIFSDKLGRLNTLVVAGVTTAILAFCWPLAKTNASIIVFSVFFGFASGAILSSATVALTICAEPANLGTYMGVGMAVASGSAILGPPASGAMIDHFGGYHEVSYFAGAMTIFGAFLAIGVKHLSPTGILGKA